MKYRVHRFDINMNKGQLQLEDFLNRLKGEVVSIIPNNRNVSLFQIYGISRKIDFLLRYSLENGWNNIAENVILYHPKYNCNISLLENIFNLKDELFIFKSFTA